MSDFFDTLRHTPLIGEPKKTILTRRESVEYGVLHIIQGVLLIFFHNRAGGPILPYIAKKASDQSRHP